jgi:hypothetical protein
MLDWFKKLLEVKRAASIKPQPKVEQPDAKPKRKVRALSGPVKKSPAGKGIKKK